MRFVFRQTTRLRGSCLSLHPSAIVEGGSGYRDKSDCCQRPASSPLCRRIESIRFDSWRDGNLGLNIHRFLPDGFVDDMDKFILAFCGIVPI